MNFGVKIGILYGSFVVLIVTMVVMSFNHKVDLVSKDYYAQELKYQDKLDALNNESSLSKSITHELSDKKIILTVDSALVSKDFKGTVNFFRPSDSSLDLKLHMNFVNNQQIISTDKFKHGAYKMQLSWKSNNKKLLQRGSYFYSVKNPYSLLKYFLNMAFIIAAITLGFFGSFHCIGMCGPIALALPVHQFSPLKKYTGVLIYNIGRIITYTLLGLLFGLLGQTFFLGGLQQALSITLGVLLLLGLIATYTQWLETPQLQFIYQAIQSLKNQLGNLFNKQGLQFLFLIGLLNGLLPCGLVYLGISGALSTGSFDKGALFMFYFGLGTIPMMFAVAYLGQFVSLNFRNVIKRAMPFVIATMAVLLILRGLNLGIPFVSPIIENQITTTGKVPPVFNCH